MNRKEKEILFEKVNKAKVISFDLFDTLLFRKVSEPETVFDIVGHRFGIPGFRKLRVQTQNEAGRKLYLEHGYPHANMDEIYEAFKSTCDIDVNWDDVKAYEIEVESDALVANKEMLDIFNEIKHLEKRIVITTDMYLMADTLDRLLRKNGFEGYSRIYCSADERKAKFNKELFAELAEKEGVKYGDILHIGDSLSADVEIPGSFGMETFLYKSEAETDKLQGTSDTGLDKGIYKICYHQEKGFWYNFGVEVAGSVYLGLYKWLRKESKEADTLYFLSRDGYNLYRLFKSRGHDKAKYLYVSRRSLILAGITKLDEEALRILPPYTFGQTVGEIFDYLEIDKKNIRNLEKAGFDNFESVIKDPADFDRFKKLYLLNEETVLKRCGEERENAVRYFRTTGFLDKDAEVFDCGWNGSSQYLMERFKKAIGCDKETFFYYFGILNTDKSRKQLHGKRYKTYLFDFCRNYNLQRDVSSATVLYELLFTASHPSVRCYGPDGIVFEDDEIEQYKDDISDGIVAFFRESYDFTEKHDVEISAEQSLSHLKRLIVDPTVSEAVTIGNIDNVDGFARKAGVSKKIAYVTEKDLENNPMTEVYWIQGLLKRDDVPEKLKQEIAIRDRYSSPAAGEYNLESENDLYTYRNWMLLNENPDDDEQRCDLGYRPKFSLVMPVYNVSSEQLKEAIDSVLAQTYNGYELIVVEDCSTWENVRPVLKEYESNSHVKIIYRGENGNISRATNDGISEASGDYLLFMDCDDTIAPDAFMEFARKINEDPDLDFIYSDEDKLTEDGKIRHLPFFKPDWSPDLIWCENYTNHLSAYKMSIVRKIGGLRSKYDGAQDYDFVLRFMEETDDSKVGHISKILYHWRERKESVAFSLDSKKYATEATRFIKEDALRRRGIPGHTEYVSEASQYRIVYEVKDNPLVSIIIPSKDNPNILKQCIESVIKHTIYGKIEIVVVDNGSSDENREEIKEYLEEKGCLYLYGDYAFNFSYMCNLGAQNSHGDYLLFLNDDVEAFDGEWLERMLGEAQQRHVGAVGAKLFYPETTLIQHAGVSNLKEGPGHAFVHQDDSIPYYFCMNRLESDFIAVTAACLMVSRNKFLQAGLFDENLKVAYNDIDLCFKLHELGYYNVVRQDAILYHHEFLSRGVDDNDPEKALRLSGEKIGLYLRHPELKGRDPFLNENIHNYCGDVLDLNGCYGGVIPFVEPESVAFDSACIDVVAVSDIVSVSGWAFLKEKDNTLNMERYVLFRDGYGSCVRTVMHPVERLDLIDAFGGRTDIRLCGFRCGVDPDKLAMDVVPRKIGVQIIDDEGHSHIYWDEKRGFLSYHKLGKRKYSDYNELKLFEPSDTDASEVVCHVDIVRRTAEGIEIKGWAFALGQKNNCFKTSVILKSVNGAYLEFETIRNERPDVAIAYSNNPFMSAVGFECIIHPDLAGICEFDRPIIRLRDNYHKDRVFDRVVEPDIT